MIFLIRTGVNVSRANGLKRKKNKLAHMYAAAPSLFFGNETALWGMDVTTCTIIALALVAVCVVCLVCMLVSGHKRKLAEEAYEDAQAESDKKRRDDDMKMMFMMMNGGRSGDSKGPQIVQTVDVREIVEETIKNLMPAMQQQLLASGMGGNDTGARLIEQQNRLIDNLLIDKKASDETLIGQEIPDELEEDEEDWDSESDEEVVEEVTPADVISPDGAVSENPATVKTTRTVRLPANFRMRLKMSSDKNREAYVELKNMFNARRGVAFRVSGCVEKIRYRGEIVAAIGVSTKHLKLWLALDPPRTTWPVTTIATCPTARDTRQCPCSCASARIARSPAPRNCSTSCSKSSASRTNAGMSPRACRSSPTRSNTTLCSATRRKNSSCAR